MNTGPVIGIMGNRIPNESRLFYGMERDYVNHDYVEAVERCGGIPFIIPICDSPETMIRLVSHTDGVLLSGGYDLHPHTYREEAHPLLGYTDQHIDTVQIACVQEIIARKIPVLAICRGLQVLNTALGGSLYQDTNLIEGSTFKHMQQAKRGETSHPVEIVPHSRLQELFGNRVMVNSFHHQCIHRLGSGLRITARAPDGVPEAIELIDPNYYFAVGVQWHPEMMHAVSASMKPLFQAFLDAASQSPTSRLSPVEPVL